MRSIGTSGALEPAVAMVGAVLLALAFPNAGQAWLAPLGAAGLFWAWGRLSWKRGFFCGWFAGTIFFAINFSWFTYTVGKYVGNFGFAVVLIPAIVEGLAFALAAALTAVAVRRAPSPAAPAAAAAAFTVFEWLRSIGPLAVPFAQVGYSQVATPLGVFAAYVGSFGVTFVVMALGAYLAQAIAVRRAGTLAIAVIVLCAAWFGCFFAWPARHTPMPTLLTAAVQGNIPQSIKWNNNLNLAVRRYTTLTERLRPLRPQLIVWPETVITTDLDASAVDYDYTEYTANERKLLDAALRENARLRTTFSQIAQSMHATLIVGSLDRHWSRGGVKEYDALYTYAPSGRLLNIYDKRQLVPFTETFPARRWLSWLPYSGLISDFGHGTRNAVISAGSLSFAPLICWESGFPDLIEAQVRAGAQFLVIPTDDAWFGPSSGTYQHAQIAQMRAIEFGRWVVQSASSGISGIVSPAGVWTAKTREGVQAVVAAPVGKPPGSVFARIGPSPIGYACAALYLACIAAGFAFPGWRGRNAAD